MSGSLLSSQTASSAATQSLSSAVNQSAAASLSSTSTGATTSALDSLAGNFNTFLTLLMTQLQNQDPTSPSDTTTFTQELATFAGVQQQVDANTNLNQLIQLTQGEETLQGSAMIGKEVTLNTTTLPLQNGSGTVDYTATTAGEPIEFTISNSSGTQVYTTTVDAPAAGSNSWTWNGQDNSGNQLADGKYSVAVQGQVGSSVAAVPFTVAGTVTGVINSGGTIELNVGALTTPLSSIQSLQ